jgi:hypothetical protein
MTNTYSKSFRDKVKQVYPDYQKIHELVDSDSYFLGRYLDDGSAPVISAKMVVESNNFEQLKTYATSVLMKRELYGAWQKEVSTWKHS